MQVDESFIDYVVARWSMLHRLAVLLVGEDGAQDLAERALVHAFLDWRDIQESPSADDRVKELLAREAAHEPSAPDPDATGFDALPRRQRIAVVLRCLELWSTHEVAAVVHCRAEEVEAEEAAALAALGVSAAEVAAELDELADESFLPVPPIEMVLTRGRDARRRRVRRSLTWTAGVSAVLLAGITVASLLEDTDPQRRPPRPAPTSLVIPDSLAGLRAGGAPQLPYVERSVLQFDLARVTSLRGRPTAVVATRNAAFVGYVDGVIDRIDMNSLTTATLSDRSRGDVVIDPDGRLIAWLERGRGKAQVHLRSLEGDDPPRDEVRTIEETPACCNTPYLLNGITRSGEVVVSISGPDANPAWVWDTRLGSVTKISGIGNGAIAQVAGDEIVVHHWPGYFAVGELRDGSLLVDHELEAEQADFADPIGKRVVYAEDGQVHVRLIEPYGRSRSLRDVRLGLPPLYTGYASIRWEDSGHVLLDVSDHSMPNGALVRCEVQDGACEIARRFDFPHQLTR